MRIFLEAGPGFSNGTDAYGREIVESANSDAIVNKCAEYLSAQKEIRDRSIQVMPIKNASSRLEEISAEDLLISVQVNLYGAAAGEGLRGFYRSSKQHNSEKCKALAITVTKGLHDHIDLYYHGVYNEQRSRFPQLESIVKSKSVAALVEIGFAHEHKSLTADATVTKNIGDGLGKGILRHLSSQH